MKWALLNFIIFTGLSVAANDATTSNEMVEVIGPSPVVEVQGDLDVTLTSFGRSYHFSASSYDPEVLKGFNSLSSEKKRKFLFKRKLFLKALVQSTPLFRPAITSALVMNDTIYFVAPRVRNQWRSIYPSTLQTIFNSEEIQALPPPPSVTDAWDKADIRSEKIIYATDRELFWTLNVNELGVEIGVFKAAFAVLGTISIGHTDVRYTSLGYNWERKIFYINNYRSREEQAGGAAQSLTVGLRGGLYFFSRKAHLPERLESGIGFYPLGPFSYVRTQGRQTAFASLSLSPFDAFNSSGGRVTTLNLSQGAFIPTGEKMFEYYVIPGGPPTQETYAHYRDLALSQHRNLATRAHSFLIWLHHFLKSPAQAHQPYGKSCVLNLSVSY